MDGRGVGFQVIHSGGPGGSGAAVQKLLQRASTESPLRLVSNAVALVDDEWRAVSAGRPLVVALALLAAAAGLVWCLRLTWRYTRELLQ
jgi:hypothetical protein